jgi:hypothetical protein
MQREKKRSTMTINELDQARSEAFAERMLGVLNDGALALMTTVSTMQGSLAQGGEGLGTMWGEEKAEEMVKEAGFGQVEIKHLPHDFQNSYYIVMKG